jgi:hypothetical protein
VKETRVTFPIPLTKEQAAAGKKPATYAPREVFARALSAEDAVKWLMDAQASGMGGLIGGASAGRSALAGGTMGLDLIKRIIKECRVQNAEGKWIEPRDTKGFNAAFNDSLRFLFDLFEWLIDFNFNDFSDGPAPPEDKAPSSDSPTD